MQSSEGSEKSCVEAVCSPLLTECVPRWGTACPRGQGRVGAGPMVCRLLGASVAGRSEMAPCE